MRTPLSFHIRPLVCLFYVQPVAKLAHSLPLQGLEQTLSS